MVDLNLHKFGCLCAKTQSKFAAHFDAESVEPLDGGGLNKLYDIRCIYTVH